MLCLMADTAAAAGRMLLLLVAPSPVLIVAVESLLDLERDVAAIKEEKLLTLFAEKRTDIASMLAMMPTALSIAVLLRADIARRFV